MNEQPLSRTFIFDHVMRTILVVDDDASTRSTLQHLLEGHGHIAVVASDGPEALEYAERVDAAMISLQMSGMSGVGLIHALRNIDATLPLIALGVAGAENESAAALKAGAHHHCLKPIEVDQLSTALGLAFAARAQHLESRRALSARALGRDLVGDSLPMRRLLGTVERVASKDVTVLLRGETGTGKELIASLVHAGSKRACNALVRFNCAALAPELAESQLFGHAKGAFTGAVGAHRGFFAEAAGGTLVLDEVGELSLNTQAALLRALQEGEIQPVGSSRPERVDVRIIASTNRDLLADVRAGRFRADLYYRLAVVELIVPPLRDRRVDIPALAEEFAQRYAKRFALEQVQLAPELLARLTIAAWPGNVRELENTIARLVALSHGGIVDDRLLEACDRCDEVEQAPSSTGTHSIPRTDTWLSFAEQVDAFERALLTSAYEAAGGNQSETARRLSLCRTTLTKKLKKHRIS
jgi:two-component system, NtrC family, response regulator AtoC